MANRVNHTHEGEECKDFSFFVGISANLIDSFWLWSGYDDPGRDYVLGFRCHVGSSIVRTGIRIRTGSTNATANQSQRKPPKAGKFAR